MKKELAKSPEERNRERILDQAAGFIVGRKAVDDIRKNGLANNPRVQGKFARTLHETRKKGD